MAELSVPRSSATSPTASQSRAPLIGVMIVSWFHRHAGRRPRVVEPSPPATDVVPDWRWAARPAERRQPVAGATTGAGGTDVVLRGAAEPPEAWREDAAVEPDANTCGMTRLPITPALAAGARSWVSTVGILSDRSSCRLPAGPSTSEVIW